MMRKFTDTYGATLTLEPQPQHRVKINITENHETQCMTINPGMALAVSDAVKRAGRLSQKEMRRAASGKKLKDFNKYTRLGEAEEPTGWHTDEHFTTLRVYPDKANHVLIELEDRNEDAVSVMVKPADLWALMNGLREATGCNGEQLGIHAAREGLIETGKPETRGQARSYAKLLVKNKKFANVVNTAERRPTFNGAAFIKGAQ